MLVAQGIALRHQHGFLNGGVLYAIFSPVSHNQNHTFRLSNPKRCHLHKYFFVLA